MTEYFKKQMEHDLTRGYYEALVEIVKKYKPKTVLEVGTGWGISGTAFMENGVEKLVTIDASTSEAYLNTARNEIETHRKEGQIVIYNWMRSGEFFRENLEKFDMVYIDGDHGYQGAKADLLAALSRLNPGGVIVMDDFMHKGNFIDGNECRVAMAAREVLMPLGKQLIIWPHNKENGFLVI